MRNLETIALNLMLLLVFSLGLVIGAITAYKIIEDKYNKQIALNTKNKDILDKLAYKINTANEICADDIKRFWLENKHQIYKQFQFKE